jgi:GNAT superfamily N-acetyltransferase
MSLSIGGGNPAPLAKLALKHRLFHKHGVLREHLQEIVSDPKNATVVILQDGEQTPHGVCIITACDNMMIFVEPYARGMGWGERLVKAALAIDGRSREKIYAGPGDNFIKSANFWRKCRINCNGCGVGMSRRETQQLVAAGLVLVFRPSEDVSIDTFESVYLRGLYDENTTDKQDGLRGQLAAIWNENLTPFDYALYHVAAIKSLQSFATIRERISGDKTVLELQLYVVREARRRGLGQEIIDKVKEQFPNQPIVGHYKPTAVELFARNQVEDIRTLELDSWTRTLPVAQI